MTSGAVPFATHVALLDHFLEARAGIVSRIERGLLAARVPHAARFTDRAVVAQLFGACVSADVPLALRPSIGALETAHWAAGFRPLPVDRYTHELDPLELVARARIIWSRSRWPGASGRAAYAATVYAAFLLRQLEYLSLRIWDDGDAGAAGHLQAVQRRLDRLNDAIGSNAFVRDARWLIQTAQGALTAELRPYFEIAERACSSLDRSTRLGLHRAGALLGAGHLRSQLHYRVWEWQRGIEAPEILAMTRNSNSMDMALIIRDLVSLLEAYRHPSAGDGPEAQLDLADAILQALSADPELLLVRLDLLGPFTMIEELFVEVDGTGPARLTSMGRTHVSLLGHYRALIADAAPSLLKHAALFDPARLAYSPLAITYGFCADLLSNMAQSGPAAQPSSGLALEDMFSSRGRLEDKRARADNWQSLPRLPGERPPFDHAQDWGAQIYARLMAALQARVGGRDAWNASAVAAGRLLLVPSSSVSGTAVPDRALDGREYAFRSGPARPSATHSPKAELLASRKEGRFLASIQTGDEWFALSKNALTMATSRGQDVVVREVPADAIAILRVTCPDLIDVVTNLA